MQVSRTAVSMVALAMACALLGATSAQAAFLAEKTSETAVKSEGGKVTITFGEYKAKCESTAGEGFVANHPGKTSSEASDEPASEPTSESEALALKLTFKGCNVEVTGKGSKEAKINAEKCQYEIYQLGAATEPARLSLRAAKSGTACVMKIEAGECSAEVGAGAAGENEYLESLKLANIKAFESEIGAESEVKELAAKSISAGCGVKEKVVSGKLKFEGAVKVKGAELVLQPLVLTEGEQDFGEVVTGGELIHPFKLKNVSPKKETLKIEMPAIKALVGEGGTFSFAENLCENQELALNAECKVRIAFKPKNKELYLVRFEVPFERKPSKIKRVIVILLRGKGK